MGAGWKNKAVITQNIDGLHQMAGSNKVLELHGSIHRNYCQKCRKFYSAQDILDREGVPYCECGGIIKPDVVLYEEELKQSILKESVDAMKQADILIIGGTSLAVYPAAALVHCYQGDKLVVINKTTTPMDDRADLLIQGKIGEIFSQIEI